MRQQLSLWFLIPILAFITLACMTPTATPQPTSPPTLALPSPRPTPSLTIEDMMLLGSQSTAVHGLPVMPEDRCQPYNPDDYPYPQSVEDEIILNYGGYIYGPYTQTLFDSKQETDIEHIVARSEAHDSGLCAASPERKARLASDYFNLTLASPSVNRHQKRANDVAEWLPEKNQCWYVNRVVDVKKEYGLSVDQAESDAIDIVLAHCNSPLPKEMIGPWGVSDGNPVPTTIQRLVPHPVETEG